ncbi:elongation of very long chain fatty acids protein 4-like [Lutzomyia longipalpis]|uniref:elongation of very long chain fatty acids protein 4-like n=1 Tax=Lutzomyia longipalpis TaxID=7200 RepID=UPI00248459BE|nr:elongation of very long chain fatty acids protein 4-like [Lutzomyia longipalpis]
MEYVHRIVDFIEYLDSLSDSRTRGWFLVDSIYTICLIAFAYLLLVLLGPKIMEKRRPFQLKLPILIYNIAISLVNAHICYELYLRTTLLNFTWFCSPKIQIANDPNVYRLATAIWLYYITKYIEMLDSLFFVLRKKTNQLSFLHVYHHTTMVGYSLLIVKWYPIGISYSPLMFNSGVHVVMYLYYGLSTLGPNVAKYLWWKKYLTMIQMIQFLIGMTIQVVSYATGCGFIPEWLMVVNFMFIGIFFILFGKFYVASYKKGQEDNKKAKLK